MCKVLYLSMLSTIAEVFPAPQIQKKRKAHAGVFVFTYLIAMAGTVACTVAVVLAVCIRKIACLVTLLHMFLDDVPLPAELAVSDTRAPKQGTEQPAHEIYQP